MQRLETDFDLASAALTWDPHRNRLLAGGCGTWRSFAPVGGGPELNDEGELDVQGDPDSCEGEDLVLRLDAEGSSLYRTTPHVTRVDHFSVEGGGLRFVGDIFADVVVLPNNNAEQVYAMTRDRLLVFVPDVDTGELAPTDFEETIDWFGAHLPVTATDDDAYLFVFDRLGDRTNLFSLEDPLHPERLATLPYSGIPIRRIGGATAALLSPATPPRQSTCSATNWRTPYAGMPRTGDSTERIG